MSQSMAGERDAVSTNSATPEGAGAVQIGLRLRASDNSGRAIVSNISSVHLSSGMAFIDFGFVEQAVLSEAARAARAGGDGKPQMADGRLECRIAMGLGDVAQLARQLQQMLAKAKRPATATPAPDEHMMPPDTSLQ